MKNMHNEIPHDQLQLLLPWFVNGSLSEAESSMISAHISDCLSCRRELRQLDQLQNAIQFEPAQADQADRAFAKISAQLSQRSIASPTAKVVPWPQKILKQTSKHPALGYALAASVLLALIPVGLKTSSQSDQASNFYTLSAFKPTSSQTGDLQVIFDKNLTGKQISTLLNTLHAHPIGSANSMGALTIHLDSEQGAPSAEQALAILRQRADVLFAEPVMQP